MLRSICFSVIFITCLSGCRKKPPVQPDEPSKIEGISDHWVLEKVQQVDVDVRNPPMRSGNAGVRLQAAIAGLGVARITATFCAQAIASGQLVRLLPQWECAPLRIHALLPGRRLVPAKVRAFFEALEEEAAQQAAATRSAAPRP